MTASPAVADTLPGSAEAPPADTDPIETLEQEPRGGRWRLLLLLFLLAALAVLMGLTVWYLLFRQPIPLPVVPGETVMPGYVTSIYGASRPMGVAVTSSGDRLFVGETGGEHTARIFDAQGNQVATLVPPESTAGDHVPTYLALNPATGDVLVSDRPSASIYVFDAGGRYLRTVTPPSEAQDWQPLGMTFDAAGSLYVVDVGSLPHVVRVLDVSGSQTRVIGASEGMSFPNGVAVDDAGYVYVTDSNNGRLLVFDRDGSVVATVARGVGPGKLGLPRGVAVDGRGRVYVADATGQAVSVYSRYTAGSQQLEYLGSFGIQGSADGAFAFPNDIAVDGRGRLYVADSANDRVQLWSY